MHFPIFSATCSDYWHPMRPQDLVVSEKCSVKLTDENFKSVIESNDYVFVFFYSATCPACRRFDPIWEETSCEYDGKKVVFAHLEGNENQGIINAYRVSHTPTLALFHRDMATPIKFNGRQYKESLLFFVKQQSGDPNPGSPAAHFTDALEALRFSFWRGTVDNHLEPSLNGFFPTTDSAEYRAFTQAVIALDGLVRCAEIISDTIQEEYNLPAGEPAIVLYRDYDERKSVYEGPWDAKAIEEWARIREHPSVGFADEQHLMQYHRKEGILVHMLVDKESVGGDWNAFQDFVFQEMAVPIFSNGIMKRGTFTIIFSDGEENKKWLKTMAPRGDSLPVALLIDFKTKYQYQPRKPLSMDTIASDIVAFVNDYSLGLATPLEDEL
ncbi:uncharacterized protein [Blastocystis hominis]|uniref:Thioredoxin domain-containing protein n=1 Tax=Blastocystis hominis TaxID=12968 RepID=D8LV42_BLAHO|nr:uncharacterized protein [Blastocystis hominis]CBK19681.2 unnamed protein product [Blastocystis hominis]|eukprot:XP_012893729.1 uncharacterized protein [Blastocystis hominis]